MNNIDEVSARIGGTLKEVMFGEVVSVLRELVAAIEYTGMDCQDRFDAAEHAARAVLTKVDSNELLK